MNYEYSGPRPEQCYTTKFVRLDGKVFTSMPHEDIDRGVFHTDLVRDSGLVEEVLDVLSKFPDRADAGYLDFIAGDLVVYGRSEGFNTSVISEARLVSAETLRGLTPNWRVWSSLTDSESVLSYEKSTQYSFDEPQRDEIREKLVREVFGHKFTPDELSSIKSIMQNGNHQGLSLGLNGLSFDYYRDLEGRAENFSLVAGTHLTIYESMKDREPLKIVTKRPVTSQ